MSDGGRWEVGSAYPLMLPSGSGRLQPAGDSRLFGSGRQALRALLEFGRREYGWEAVHLPTYYSPSVAPHISDLLPVRRYDAGPLGPQPRPLAGPSDVVVAMSYFGAPPVLPVTAGTLVVDVTHDPVAPWMEQVRADYFYASLHKTLPLPDGGLLWSGTGRGLPSVVPPTEHHLATVSRILSAMCLKAAYRDGAPVTKEQFLPLYAAGEKGFRSTPVSGISDFSREALRLLPAVEMRRRRVENAAELASGLRDIAGARIHPHTFGVVLEFDSPERREAVRRSLVARNVYPAVLWDLRAPEAPPHQVDFSRRMLHMHTDARWTEDDMRRVAAIARQVSEAEPAARARPAALSSHPTGG